MSKAVNESLCGLLVEVTSGSSYQSEGKKPCNTEMCWQCQEHPFFALVSHQPARFPWEEENVVVPIPTCAFTHTPVSLVVFAVSIMASQ